MTCEELLYKLQNFEIGEPMTLPFTELHYVNIGSNKIEEFTSVVNNLFIKSIDEDFFWAFCSFKTYKNTFDHRLKSLQKEKIDFDLLDFSNSELKNIRRNKVKMSVNGETMFDYCFLMEYDFLLTIDILPKALQDNLVRATDKKIKYLKELISNRGRGEINTNIFSNNGFNLFVYLNDNGLIKEKNKRGRITDIHFCFLQLSIDGFIHATFEKFKEWYSNTYHEDIGQSITMDKAKGNRLSTYKVLLNSFQEQN